MKVRARASILDLQKIDKNCTCALRSFRRHKSARLVGPFSSETLSNTHNMSYRGRHHGFKSRTVECYDCHQQVYELKAHRAVCISRKGPTNNQWERTRHEKRAKVVEGTSDVFVLQDLSGSMGWDGRLGRCNGWVQQFADGLAEDDRLGYISFDSRAFCKLHLKPVGKLRRKKELEALLARVYAKDLTALYDAIWMGVEQVLDETRNTHLIVLSDGEDNASSHKLEEIEALLLKSHNVHVSFVQLDTDIGAHRRLCDISGGTYHLIDKKSEGDDMKPIVKLLQDFVLSTVSDQTADEATTMDTTTAAAIPIAQSSSVADE